VSGRVAVVTGAGQGIGRGIAGVLAARGLRVVVVDRHADRARATADAIGLSVVPVVADLLDEDAVAAMAATVLERLGRWDVLVNNAGSLRFGTVAQTTSADWDAAFAGCVKTAWLCTRAAAGPLAASGDGRVVNVSSVVARGATSDWQVDPRWPQT
jgi:NAD(P)-dependent dehydrogenase (short-subunit alcohol dehydrogenase family)